MTWIKLYLENSRFKVKTGTTFSEVKESNIGVPQGSVLGPVLFNCFMAGLPWIFESLGVKCHLFADDTQFVVTFEKGDEMSARSKVVEIFATINPLETTTNNIGTIAMVQSTGANNIGRD